MIGMREQAKDLGSHTDSRLPIIASFYGDPRSLRAYEKQMGDLHETKGLDGLTSLILITGWQTFPITPVRI